MRIFSKIGVLFFILSFSLAANAQIYKWVDNEGRTHFSQQPPPTVEDRQYPEVVQVKKKRTFADRIRTVNGEKFCGDLKLPSNTDPVMQLINTKSQLDNWSRSIERQNEWKRQLLNRQSRYSSSGSNYDRNRNAITAVNHKIKDLKCGLEWAESEIESLQPDGAAFQREYAAAVEEFERFKNQCGPKPDIQGYTNDPRALEWGRCESARSTREHNKMLRKLKGMKALAQMLEE